MIGQNRKEGISGNWRDRKGNFMISDSFDLNDSSGRGEKRRRERVK